LPQLKDLQLIWKKRGGEWATAVQGECWDRGFSLFFREKGNEGARFSEDTPEHARSLGEEGAVFFLKRVNHCLKLKKAGKT